MANELNPETGILKISEIFKIKTLNIPDYQRPYKWKALQVNQLLDDLKEHYVNNQQYRIGAVILHKDEEHNIVDGQQRLTTLALLLNRLKSDIISDYIKNQKFNHSISFENIKANDEIIKNFLNLYFSDENERTNFCKYILNQCEMVVITLNNIDEAFQFFDSQNARGKSLEPYDLLKAYHLRAEKNQEEQIYDCIEKWEKAAESSDQKSSELELIISKLLFRIKRWQEQEEGEIFLPKHLYVFKGANLDDDYPYLKTVKQSIPYIDSDHYPHQILNPMINGRFFFYYVEHYRHLYKKLFAISNKEKSIKGGLLEEEIAKLNSYTGSSRTGDRYVKNLFICAVLFYFDKFGEGKNGELKAFAKIAMKWAYWLRLYYARVSYPTIENYAKNRNSLLFKIASSYTTNEIFKYKLNSFEEKFEFDNVGKLKGYLGVENDTK